MLTAERYSLMVPLGLRGEQKGMGMKPTLKDTQSPVENQTIPLGPIVWGIKRRSL